MHDPSMWSVGIVVPARNEQARIRRCLRSLLVAVSEAHVARACVVVLADRCTDQTVARARSILDPARGLVVEAIAGNAGIARRLGTEIVLKELASVPRDRLWLASTDADSYVPPDWLIKQLELAERGASAVAGVVEVDSFSTHGPNGTAIFSSYYKLAADGTHEHVHGANFGVRADAYLDVGGWSDVPAGEDHCLWRRVRARGWPVESSATSVVTTSGRLRGRARGGFADTLRTRLRSAALGVAS